MIEQRTGDGLGELLRGAAVLSHAGNRTAAIAALGSAVALAPDDLTAHRRLAAAYANAGDTERARAEYERFIAQLEVRGCPDAAAAEHAYAAMLFTPRPAVSDAPARRGLTKEQSVALRRVGVAVVAIAATMAVMIAAGAQIFASGGPLL
ncbi:MAG TPA: tetratricopeptide repeat protein [Candidatus Saccharimonadales bacterium]|nr:tetratricopeptide repeat protein [Candidatus Saccharimonadales bacterium]